jgi:predicted glycoside hydrolase/deacetylase ChbG (UPF0249 family)
MASGSAVERRSILSPTRIPRGTFGASAQQERALIERAMQPEFLERALAFQKIFQKMDADEMDVKIVEALLASVAKKTRQTVVA